MQTNLNMVAVTGNQQNMDMFNSQVSLIMDSELHIHLKWKFSDRKKRARSSIQFLIVLLYFFLLLFSAKQYEYAKSK